MKKSIFGAATFAAMFFLCSASKPLHFSPHYFVLNINEIGATKLAAIKQDPEIRWWVEAGPQLLVFGQLSDQVKGLSRSFDELDITPNPDRLLVVRKAHEKSLEQAGVDVLIDGGRSAVIQSREDAIPKVDIHTDPDQLSQSHLAHARIELFMPGMVLSHQAANDEQFSKGGVSWAQKTRDRLESIDGERWFSDIEKLASYNRYSRGSDILNARDWAVSEFEMLDGFTVTLEEFRVSSTPAFNVVATILGSDEARRDDVYVVSGHYDAISENSSNTAPGAEDNASGSAGVLELARAFAKFPPAATVKFILFAGEEQGLLGSEDYVRKQVANSELSKIKAVINMDMIGYSRTTEDLTVLLETEEFARPLSELLAQSAGEFTSLKIETSYDAWGSDHVPFLDKHLQSILTIDNDWSRYPAYHRSGDKPENINREIGPEILKMNAAALGKMVD